LKSCLIAMNQIADDATPTEAACTHDEDE